MSGHVLLPFLKVFWFVCINDSELLLCQYPWQKPPVKNKRKSSLRHCNLWISPLIYRAPFLLANCLLVLLAYEKENSHRATAKPPTQAASAAAQWDIRAPCHVGTVYKNLRHHAWAVPPILLKLQHNKIRREKVISYLLSSLCVCTRVNAYAVRSDGKLDFTF